MKEILIAPKFEKNDFKKSSFSFYWNCVQTACKENVIAVGDTKNPDGPVLLFDKAEWNAFILGVKNGEFDY